MKISIICPLYKGEKYVDKIIEMINRNFDYCKTYIKNISVELIFINDYPNEHIQINKNTDINIFLYQNLFWFLIHLIYWPNRNYQLYNKE